MALPLDVSAWGAYFVNDGINEAGVDPPLHDRGRTLPRGVRGRARHGDLWTTRVLRFPFRLFRRPGFGCSAVHLGARARGLCLG